MALGNLVAAWRRDANWVERAERIAAEALAELWPHMADRVTDMKLSQARGYLRARARAAISQRVDRQLVGSQHPTRRTRMIDAALDEVVRLGAVRVLAAPQWISTPLRRAA